MSSMAIQQLTRMIEELPEPGQARVRDFVESLWAKSKQEKPGPRSQSMRASPVSAANRRMLELLEKWKVEPLPPGERHVFDDFEAFQREHPLRFALPGDAR